jgi:hypothetical protein
VQSQEGPAKELREKFESESRDTTASETERQLKEAFEGAQGETDLFKTVECRRTVCRVQLRWSSLRVAPYLAAIKRAQPLFQPPMAASATAPEDSDGIQPLDVYLKRTSGQ